MKTRKQLFLVSGMLVFVILISGCLGGGGAQKQFSDGIQITQFISDYPSIDAGERMSVEVDFENIGDMVATGITGELVRKGAFDVDPFTPQQAVTDLEPPITDVPSGDAFIWELTAPDVSQDRTDEIQARIRYSYKSEGFGTIHFVPRDIKKEKGVESFQINPSSSSGPLDIEVIANQPYIIRDPSVLTADMRLTFLITNVGSGRVESQLATLPGNCNKALDCIDEVKIEGFGATCVDDTTGLPLAETIPGARLVEGNEGKLTKVVTLRIADPNAATSCQIKVTATYSYRTDSPILNLLIKKVE